MNIRNKLTEYFLHGGLFNPELMEHKKVCQLLIEARREISLLDNKLTEYFLHGGLFNPELMEHKKVCQLLIEARREISLLDNKLN